MSEALKNIKVTADAHRAVKIASATKGEGITELASRVLIEATVEKPKRKRKS